ncbi:MAG TPA: metallopeptidase TldD-related protein [Methanocorpusculum sp.]|nr:metallopeptidase TldD-related protein [Methanocorpusculum sp.]
MPEIDIDAIISKGLKRADEIEVYTASYEDLTLEQRGCEISSVFEHSGTTIYLRVVKDKRIGVSATSDITKIDAALTAALSSAKLSEIVSEWNGFPEKSAIPNGDEPIDRTLEISPETAKEYLSRMNSGAAKYPEARPVSGGVTLNKGMSRLANSNGVYLEREFSDIVLGMDAICDGSTGYSSDSSPFAARINPEKVGEETAFFASASRNGESIESKKYDVVFSEDAVDSLILELFSEAVNGRNVLTGKSVYAGKLGEKVAADTISITDEPMNKSGSAWRRFDTEGTAAKDTPLIRCGVLESFLYDTKTAVQAGCVSTGHAHRTGSGSTLIEPHCLTIKAPTEDVLERPCLYVKEVIGAHTANPLTGEFSVESANAFLAEGGELKTPVKKAMLAGNIFGILAGELTASKDVKALSGALVPKLRIAGLQVI